MKKICNIAIVLLLVGCASQPRAPQFSHPSAPSGLQSSIEEGKQKTQRATTGTENAVKIVERVISKTDPTTAQELQLVRAELFRVQADLRDATNAFVKAEGQRIEMQEWGNNLQKISDANAAGWQKSEIESVKWHSEASKQKSLAWKWRRYFAYLSICVVTFFVLRQYLPFLKFL